MAQAGIWWSCKAYYLSSPVIFNEINVHQCAINALTPQEIGYASAYEAYRVWIHNNSLYEPLGAEIERQREAFTGLAIAEGTNFHQYFIPHAHNILSFSH